MYFRYRNAYTSPLISAFLVCLVLIILTSCGVKPGEHLGGVLTKEQVLELDPDADIFELKDRVYKVNKDWVEKEQLTKEKQVGEILDGMATKLPIGAKIFSVKERNDILIVEYDDIELRYLVQIGE